MGWLWMCLGIRDKSARRIGGRVSSDTYLSPQFDPTKTPRIEDYLQPRRAGYDVFVNGHPPESPTSKSNNTSSTGDKDSEPGNNRSHKGTHLYRRSVSESIKGEYGPYWGYAEDMPAEDFMSIEFPRVTPSTRKSFSELLIETDTLDKGPLALAAMAAAAERAARSVRLQKAPSSPSGIQVKEVNSAEGSQRVTLKVTRNNSSEDLEKEPALEVQGGAGGRSVVTAGMETHEFHPRSPQSPHPMPLLDAASISSLSKDHLEASNAVAAFRESRRQQSQMSERSSTQQTGANSSYISNFFRSSRKRSIPFKSRSFQRPLSPVPEVLSLDEELRSKRKSDVTPPTTHDESGETATSSGSVNTPLSIPPSKKQQWDSELGRADAASNFSLTEEWDDYVLVERVQEMPTSGQRDEDRGENQGRDNEDPPTSSINGRILDEGSDLSSNSSEVALQDDATSVPQEDVRTSTAPQTLSSNLASDFEGQQEDDTLLRTPIRDPLVTPEVFISPKTTTAELNFTRVMDIDPEERPIFGSLADHWEAAWATKRPTWDGKGIPNSTNKYREDQKVMWHAAPFEERLAQALATQQVPAPQRRNSFNGRSSSRLAASRSDMSLQAH